LQQARLIERLKALGIDAAHAEQTLAIFENNLKIFEDHRDLLVRRDAPRNFTVVGTALTPTGPAAKLTDICGVPCVGSEYRGVAIAAPR
jgi:hypothetical protein